MLGARSLLLISLACVAMSTDGGAAQSLFPFAIPSAVPLSLSPEAPVRLPPDVDPNYLPPDADPNYSTLAGFDKDVNMSLTTVRAID